MIRPLHFLAAALLLHFAQAAVHAQISISATSTPYTEDFSSLGTSATATTPSGWLVDKNSSAVRTVGAWSSAVNATNYRAGDNMSSSAANGIYNYAAGDAAAAADRAVGFISSGSGTKSGNVYAYYRNNTGGAISSFLISYKVEKYRGGTNSAGFAIGLHYSTDGVNWTSAGASFLTSFTADAANSGFSPAPGATVPVSGTVVLAVPANGDFYLAWNYSVSSGTTTTNAQGLGIDDVSVTAVAGTGPLPTTVQFASASSSALESAGTVTIDVTIANPSLTVPTSVEVALTGGSADNGVDVVPAYSTQTLTFPAGNSTPLSITIAIFNDAVFEGGETLQFQLQNVSGGNSASAGPPASHTFSILDDDSPPLPPVVVNEYFNANDNISNYEAVELLVVQDGLDLRGFRIADATSGGTYPYGSITFSQDALWSGLQAGTVIVIAGLFAVPSQDLDPSDGLLIVYAPAANNSNQYFSAASNIPSIAAASDAIAILDAAGSFVHGLAHGSSNQNTLPFGRHGWHSGSINSGQSVCFTRSSGAMTAMDFLSNSFTAATAPTLAAANDALGNRDFLRSSRSRQISSVRNLQGTFFWDVTLNDGTVTMTGPVNIGNRLTIAGGVFNENSQGLTLDGNGNALNGSGAGDILVGDNAQPEASLLLETDIAAFSGVLDPNRSDATVEYRGTNPQIVIPAAYHNLLIRNGDANRRKTLNGDAGVGGILNIGAGAWLQVPAPGVITLGPAGTYVNAGGFFGSIKTPRNASSIGGPESFGGIGLSLTPAGPVTPGAVTVTMTSGTYVWVGNLPSILKRYSVEAGACAAPVTLAFRYESSDLNGQTEAALAPRRLPPAPSSWTSPGGSLNTGSKTITISTDAPCGIWTAHADPPQGTLAAAPPSLAFEAEQNHLLPPAQTVAVSNLNGSGSIIEWTAVASTGTTPSWLDVAPSPASGVNSGSFSAAVLRNDLAPGVYHGSIAINDPHAANNPLLLPVTYTVQAPRRICVGADTIFIKATPKRADVKKDIVILNCGGAFGPDKILWSVSTATPWLTVDPAAGVEGEAFTLTAATALMQPQTRYGAVTITGVHSLRGGPVSNSPLIVPVLLEVEPNEEAAAQTGPMSPGASRLLLNARGQRIAAVKLNSGSLAGLTARVFPDRLPPGISRLRYAMRYYSFEAQGGPYNLDLVLYYTGNELTPFLAVPAELRGWRQYPVGGVWHATAGFSTPVMNSVTINGVTDLSGAWAMAGVFTPFPMPLRRAAAERTGAGSAMVKWELDLPAASMEFVVERRAAGEEAWRCVGTGGAGGSSEFVWHDTAVDERSHEYRLFAFTESGEAYEAPPVPLGPWAPTSAAHTGSAGEMTLQQSIPNPVSIGGRALLGFSLSRQSHVRLSVFDAYGRELAVLVDRTLPAGPHAAGFESRGLPAGTYFYRLAAEDRAATRRLLIR